jgi:hypothetical protein
LQVRLTVVSFLERIAHFAIFDRMTSRERGSSGSGGFARIGRRYWQNDFAANHSQQLSTVNFQPSVFRRVS